MRRWWPVSTVLLVPVLIRVPFWLLGLQDNPIWSDSWLALPGHSGWLPGLPFMLDPNAGWTTQALGGAAARQWLAGQIPWWDSFSGTGLPLAAEMQSSALFLPYILLLALPGGTVLLTVALQWTAGLGTWRLLRVLDLPPWPAAAGAVLFELGASFAWMGPPANLPVAFLPTFILGIELARRGGGVRLIALSVALSLYAGFPETAYLDGLLALVWAVYRLATNPGRVAFASRVGLGGVVGLLLSAPLIWPFLDLVRSADLGTRDTFSMAILSWPEQAWTHVLLPYALGLPAGLSGVDASGTLFWLWGRAGGYIGVALAVAAGVGGLAPGPHRALRAILLGWVVLMLGRVLGIPGLREWFLAVPFQSQLQVFRYAIASWGFPCCVLAAFALARPAPRWLARGVAALLLLAGGYGASLAWPLIRPVPTGYLYFDTSVVIGLALCIATAWALPRGGRLAMGVVLGEAVLVFAMPYAAMPRGRVLDWGAIQFLQTHAGLQRFTTVGPFAPNYGAWFGVASVNYTYLPVPARWADHVKTALRPGAEGIHFPGNFPLDQPGRPTNLNLLHAHLPAYAALGVRYLITPATTLPPPPGVSHAVTLDPGVRITGEAEAAPGLGLLVTIGTFLGQASGLIEAELCSAAECVRGSAPLDRAYDNLPVSIVTGTPAGPGPYRWAVWQAAGSPAAVWHDDGHPRVALLAPPAPGAPIPVYSSPIMTVSEIPGAAPYFEAAGCALRPASRTELDADCPLPATLIRREMMLPGWLARVGDTWVEPATAEPLFQAVPLPAGPTHISFRYRPPGTTWFTALFALGLAGLAAGPAALRSVLRRQIRQPGG